MEIERTIKVKLTGKEYTLLQDAADLIGHIISEVDCDKLGEGYDLRGVEYVIYAFLDDTNVEVEWENE